MLRHQRDDRPCRPLGFEVCEPRLPLDAAGGALFETFPALEIPQVRIIATPLTPNASGTLVAGALSRFDNIDLSQIFSTTSGAAFSGLRLSLNVNSGSAFSGERLSSTLIGVSNSGITPDFGADAQTSFSFNQNPDIFSAPSLSDSISTLTFSNSATSFTQATNPPFDHSPLDVLETLRRREPVFRLPEVQLTEAGVTASAPEAAEAIPLATLLAGVPNTDRTPTARRPTDAPGLQPQPFREPLLVARNQVASLPSSSGRLQNDTESLARAWAFEVAATEPSFLRADSPKFEQQAPSPATKPDAEPAYQPRERVVAPETSQPVAAVTSTPQIAVASVFSLPSLSNTILDQQEERSAIRDEAFHADGVRLGEPERRQSSLASPYGLAAGALALLAMDRVRRNSINGTRQQDSRNPWDVESEES